MKSRAVAKAVRENIIRSDPIRIALKTYIACDLRHTIEKVLYVRYTNYKR